MPKLDPAIFEKLKGRLSDKVPLESVVGTLLARNGVSLPRDHDDRKQLALDLPRVLADAYETVKARRDGGTTLTPPQPALIEIPLPPSPALSVMRAKWIELAKPGDKARDDNKLYIDAFIGQFGDLPVSQITRAMVREFRDLLAKRPRNMPRDLRKLPLRMQVAAAATMPECRLLTPHTVNAKGIGGLSVVMEVAKGQDVIAANPCAGLLLRIKGKACERLPYSSKDLSRLGASPVYAEGKRWKAGAGEAAFWMPLIAMFEGARLEEIGQLQISDIRREDGIPYFYFLDLDDGETTSVSEQAKKQLKTAAARRVVPIHPFLIKICFLGYVDWLRARGESQLFPELKLYRGRCTKEWSKWWGRYTDEYITKSPHKVFHSFRHGFLDRLRNMTRSEFAGVGLAGHADPMYGNTLSLQTRNSILRKLRFPGVDLSLFEAAAAKLPYLKTPPQRTSHSRSTAKKVISQRRAA